MSKLPPTYEAPRRLTADGAETPDELAMAALLSRVPSAEPDDLAVARVWKRLLSPGDRRAPYASWPVVAWIPAVALALGLALFIAWPALRGTSPSMELAASSGGVFSTRPAENWRAGKSGEALSTADRVRTDATGRALLRIRGVAAVLEGADSDVGLERIAHGTFLRLSRGTITSRVAKRKPDDPFVVQTDRYTVRVVGTLFTVEQGPGDRTAVSVREGVVDVFDDEHHRAYRVTAGTRWTSDAAEERTPDRTPEEVKNLLEGGLAGRPWTELGADLAAWVAKPGSPPKAPTGAPAAATRGPATEMVSAPESVSGGASVTNAPKGALVVPPSPSPASAVTPPVVATASAEPVAPAPPVASSEAPAAASVEVPSPPPPAGETPYAKGLALEAKGDFDGAARELARAAETDPARGDLALYTLGRLAQRRLHDPKRALAAFSLYRERYPRGALLPEVDLAILELDVEGHRATEALAESTRFLALHPTSERVDQVHLLRGNLLRDGDRCREALDDYAAVRRPAQADDALYSTAYCQRRLGDRTRAAATLQEYLKRFPGGAHREDAQKALDSGNDDEKNF